MADRQVDVGPPRGRLAWVVASMAALLTVGCVANPVGPVASVEAYREKASSTVGDVISSVATVHLAGDAELDGSSVTAYTVQITDDALDGVRTAQDTFETIVPPDAESEQLRTQVLDDVAESRRAVSDVLTALQTGEHDALVAAVAALEPLASKLDGLQRSLEGSAP